MVFTHLNENGTDVLQCATFGMALANVSLKPNKLIIRHLKTNHVPYKNKTRVFFFLKNSKNKKKLNK